MSSDELVFGLHSVQAALEYAPSSINSLWLERSRKDRRLRTLAESAAAAGVEPQWCSRGELDRITAGARHQGAAARLRAPEIHNEAFLEQLLTRLEEPPLLLVLDGVQDPHNLGACLRTADAVGVHALIAPRDRACGLTPTVRKVASGAVETVPFVQVTNLARTLRMLQHAGVTLVGTAVETNLDLYEADLRGPLGLVMGAEGSGMRRLTREHCDMLVRIPMRGTVQSLNVSVATGVCLFEAWRQRHG